MAIRETQSSTRRPRASRRRPDVPLPEVQRIRPRSGLSRDEVIANQRGRIFAGLATALVYHGYEDTKIADVIELAGVSRATFYERFEGKDQCFAAAYEDGVGRISAAVEAAAGTAHGWPDRLSAGLRAGLEFLAADPALAHLLLVESLAATRPVRLEHERTLDRLGAALCPPLGEEGPGIRSRSVEAARLLAGGVASHLSGRVLAGEAARLPESHDILLSYLLTPVPTVAAQAADGR